MSELEKEVFKAIEEAEMTEGDLKRILGIAEGIKLQKDRQKEEEKEKGQSPGMIFEPGAGRRDHAE